MAVSRDTDLVVSTVDMWGGSKVDWTVYYMVVSKAGETALLKAVLRAFYSVEGTVTLKGGSWVIEVVVSKV